LAAFYTGNNARKMSDKIQKEFVLVIFIIFKSKNTCF